MGQNTYDVQYAVKFSTQHFYTKSSCISVHTNHWAYPPSNIPQALKYSLCNTQMSATHKIAISAPSFFETGSASPGCKDSPFFKKEAQIYKRIKDLQRFACHFPPWSSPSLSILYWPFESDHMNIRCMFQHFLTSWKSSGAQLILVSSFFPPQNATFLN